MEIISGQLGTYSCSTIIITMKLQFYTVAGYTIGEKESQTACVAPVQNRNRVRKSF